MRTFVLFLVFISLIFGQTVTPSGYLSISAPLPPGTTEVIDDQVAPNGNRVVIAVLTGGKQAAYGRILGQTDWTLFQSTDTLPSGCVLTAKNSLYWYSEPFRPEVYVRDEFVQFSCLRPVVNNTGILGNAQTDAMTFRYSWDGKTSNQLFFRSKNFAAKKLDGTFTYLKVSDYSGPVPAADGKTSTVALRPEEGVGGTVIRINADGSFTDLTPPDNFEGRMLLGAWLPDPDTLLVSVRAGTNPNEYSEYGGDHQNIAVMQYNLKDWSKKVLADPSTTMINPDGQLVKPSAGCPVFAKTLPGFAITCNLLIESQKMIGQVNFLFPSISSSVLAVAGTQEFGKFAEPVAITNGGKTGYFFVRFKGQLNPGKLQVKNILVRWENGKSTNVFEPTPQEVAAGFNPRAIFNGKPADKLSPEWTSVDSFGNIHLSFQTGTEFSSTDLVRPSIDTLGKATAGESFKISGRFLKPDGTLTTFYADGKELSCTDVTNTSATCTAPASDKKYSLSVRLTANGGTVQGWNTPELVVEKPANPLTITVAEHLFCNPQPCEIKPIVTGASNPTVTYSGLPSWMVQNGINASGRPTRLTEEVNFPITIRVIDGTRSAIASTTIHLLQVDPPAVRNNDLPAATTGTEYSVKLDIISATETYKVAIDGAPEWLTLTDDNSLTGIPDTEGTFTVTVIVTDELGQTGARRFELQVAPAPSPDPEPAPSEPADPPTE